MCLKSGCVDKKNEEQIKGQILIRLEIRLI